MSDSRKYIKKSVRLAITIATVSIVAFICSAYFVGFRYETNKFKALLTTLTLILVYQTFFADVLLMLLKATVNGIFLRFPWTEDIKPIFVGSSNRKEFLKRRIAALKYQLELGPTFYKRNEAMTLKYKEILSDLILFGGYLAILLILVIGTRDPLLYYNTRTIKDVLRNTKLSNSTISSIVTSDELYNFLNGTIIKGFNDGTSYNGKSFFESGWMDLQIAKVLGVIRLRQIRHMSLKKASSYESANHGPGWMRQAVLLQYKDMFWRIFKPWQYQDDVQTGGVDRTGKLHFQPGGGYVALLGRNAINSRRVLYFLRKNHWIDRHTAVVLIEFTLYNVDADIFTLVTISAEQTAFDSFVVIDKIESLKLLFNIDNLEWYVLLKFLAYFLVLMRVIGDVILKIWYSASVKVYLSISWNYADMTIVCLNIFIGMGVWIREVSVKKLLHQLEASKRNEFVSFYGAALVDETCTMLIALLIALSTLRLWKILQFERVFRVLTSTLHHAKEPLASTTFFIGIFLTAIGLSSYIINGSNSPCFAEFVKSITTLLSLSFGFGATVTPSEMNYGGRVMGFILYALLAVVVTVFLLNMFITVVCLNFSTEKLKDADRLVEEDPYTFWQFLKSELVESDLTKLFKRTNGGGDVLRLRGGGSRLGKTKDVSANESDRLRRVELVSELLETQMDLLEESLDTLQGDEELSVHSIEAVVAEEHIDLNNENKSNKDLKNVKILQKKEKASNVKRKQDSFVIRGV